jgi:hypothetical protein
MYNGDEESPGKEGKEDHQEEITMQATDVIHEIHICNSTTKRVFVVLFLNSLSPSFIPFCSKKGAVDHDGYAQTELPQD